MNSSRESPQQQRNLNETKNISTILPPEITSTPFISNKSKAPSPLVTPTKRFLGPRRYALSNNGMLNPRNAIKDPPGPLLASTSYNVNVSTYIDTKSPGYAGRLVQYNEESSRKQQNTHQERYGSPGLFPIVHLFKKDVPVISPKLNKGTVRIGTPESKGYYSQEHSRLLLEGIVRNNSILKEQNNANEASTRSVLDALKEISRKRIHANEDYDSIEDNNKKFRKSNGEGDYTKRNRVESPPPESTNSPPTTQPKKRLCTIDAVLASKTSSMYANYEISNKRKTTEDSNNIICPTNKKKFSNVETQTPGTPVIVRELKRTSITKEPEKEKIEEVIEKNEVADEITSTPKPVLKVLDDKPLEVIRKNRLGALLSALSGREIPSIPMEDRRKALDQDWPSQKSEKGLVSILSPQNKQMKSAEKHVTFDLPKSAETVSSNNLTNSNENSSNALKEKDKKADNLVQNNYSAPLTFSPTYASQEANKSLTTATSKQPLNTICNSDTPNKKEEKENIVGGFKFDFNKAMDSKSKSINAPVSLGNESEQLKTKPESNGNSSTPNHPEMFELKSCQPESESPIVKSTSQDFLSSKSSSISSLGLPTSLPLNNSTKSSPAVRTSSPFSFGTKSISDATSVSNEMGVKETVAFTFGRKGEDLGKPTNTVSSPSAGKFDGSSINSGPFGSKNVTSPTFTFVGNGNFPANFSTGSKSTTSYTSTTSSTASSFSASTSSVSATTNVSVSTSDISSKLFGNLPNSSPSKASFQTSGGNPGGFKFNPGNSIPSFGSSSKNSLSMVTTSSPSGSENPASSSTKNLFDAKGKTDNAFGLTTSAASSIFGSNSVPNNAFTQGSKPFVFGSNEAKSSNNTMTSLNSPSTFTFSDSKNTVTSSLSTSSTSNLQFTSVANTNNKFASEKNSKSFGQATISSFGTPTNSFNFSVPNTAAVTTTSSSSLFNTSNTATFGTTNISAFGNTNTSSFTTSTTPSFSSTNTPNFGVVSTSTFGTTNNPSYSTSSAHTFSNSNTPSFGTNISSSFGTKNTSNLGATNTPSFGTTASSFGTNSIPNFGTNSTGTFGTTNTPSFSTSNTSFNSTSTPSFGTVSSSSFGTSNPSSFATAKPTLFGSSNPPTFGTTNNDIPAGTNNTFGTASTAVNAFGTTTPTFGTPKSSLFGATNTPTFGNTTTAPSFGSSFSSPSTLNAPSFGTPSSPFGNNVTISSNTSAFGNPPATNSFGTFSSNNTQFTSVTSTSAFGTNTNNTFGNATTVNAFAANSTNNTFGSPASASPFGSTSTNSFASNFGKKPEQPSNVFQAPSNNMFNNNASFGSGPSSSIAGTGSSSGVFTFGSSNSNAPSTGVFTFGASEPPKAFNFNTTGSSVNVPNPATSGFSPVPSFGPQNPAVPNMFSIGSGNTSSQSQARSRPVVRARRRT